MGLRDTLPPEFDHEMANTPKTLERIPEDKLDWKPQVNSRQDALETFDRNVAAARINIASSDVPVPSIYGPSADEGGFWPSWNRVSLGHSLLSRGFSRTL